MQCIALYTYIHIQCRLLPRKSIIEANTMVLYNEAKYTASPHYDARPDSADVSLLVIHNISLPPSQFGTPGIRQLFTGTLNPDEHPFYREIAGLRVSAHCVIYRTGEIEQFVPFEQRA
jgi:AmpD protein